MLTRDPFCTMKVRMPHIEGDPELSGAVVSEHSIRIADAKGRMLYSRVISLAKDPDVTFSNETVGDLAKAYKHTSRKLKRAACELDEEREKIAKLAAFIEHAPALIEVFDYLYGNLPDCIGDIPVQNLEEASLAAEELRKYLIDKT